MAQYSVSQILEAGRRAEMEKKYEFAQQFYQHITEYYPSAPEAGTAKEGLVRIAAQQASTPALSGGPLPLSPSLNGGGHGAQVVPPPPLQPPPGVKPTLNGAGYHGAPPPPPARPTGPGFAPPQPKSTLPTPTVAPLPVEMPAPISDYRAGKIVASVFAGIGWLAFGLGIVLVVLGLLGVFGIFRIPIPLPGGGPLGYGILAMVSGLSMVFWAQLARATFDGANATRELLEIERMRLEREAQHH